MTVFYLAKKGYGTVKEIKDWDTKQFLDAVEFDTIENSIRNHVNSK
jgi:hypothetical protein